MANVKIDLNKKVKPMKPLHAGGQPPLGGKDLIEYFHYVGEAGIPYSRLHDVGGAYGANRFVDVPNIFRDFDADADDPENYDFAFTDVLISKMIENKVEPIYRLGVTIENYTSIKRYNTYPPADFKKWAKICEMIVRHYNHGWANGFEFGIKYWEIWNEPDGNVPEPEKSGTWAGTPEQFYDMYVTATKHLRECFGDSIKLGGYASCGFYTVVAEPEKYGIDIPNTAKEDDPARSAQYHGFVTFFENFLDYVKENNAPLDFFTWHSYASTSHNVLMQSYVEKTLAEKGFSGVETHLNEWNNAYQREYRGTTCAASRAAAMMCAMHKTSIDMMCYYDSRIGPSMFAGLFDANTTLPISTYYSFKAFGELYALGNCVEIEEKDLFSLAAVSDDGEKKAVLLTNLKDESIIKTNVEGFKAYLIEKDVFLEEISVDTTNFELKKYQTVLLKNY